MTKLTDRGDHHEMSLTLDQPLDLNDPESARQFLNQAAQAMIDNGHVHESIMHQGLFIKYLSDSFAAQLAEFKRHGIDPQCLCGAMVNAYAMLVAMVIASGCPRNFIGDAIAQAGKNFVQALTSGVYRNQKHLEPVTGYRPDDGTLHMDCTQLESAHRLVLEREEIKGILDNLVKNSHKATLFSLSVEFEYDWDNDEDEDICDVDYGTCEGATAQRFVPYIAQAFRSRLEAVEAELDSLGISY